MLCSSAFLIEADTEMRFPQKLNPFLVPSSKRGLPHNAPITGTIEAPPRAEELR